MGRAIAAVVSGYVTMFAFVFISLSIAYLVMGPERSFLPGSYAVSTNWALVSLVLSFVAALCGGWVCGKVATTRKPVVILASIVVVLGLAMAIPTLQAPDPSTLVRSGDVGNFEAFSKVRSPAWVSVLTPLLGAVGVLLGGRRGT